jgi:hypothetical protein
VFANCLLRCVFKAKTHTSSASTTLLLPSLLLLLLLLLSLQAAGVGRWH